MLSQVHLSKLLAGVAVAGCLVAVAACGAPSTASGDADHGVEVSDTQGDDPTDEAADTAEDSTEVDESGFGREFWPRLCARSERTPLGAALEMCVRFSCTHDAEAVALDSSRRRRVPSGRRSSIVRTLSMTCAPKLFPSRCDCRSVGVDLCAMSDTTTTLPPFQVSRAAIDQIELLGGAVRIDVEDGGCCGSAYAFTQLPADYTRADDEAQFGCPGAWLIVGARATTVMTGATLDYSDRLKPPRFRVINNPNTDQICSCRRSFGRPWPGPGQPQCRSYLPMPWDNEYEPPTRWKRQTGYD